MGRNSAVGGFYQFDYFLDFWRERLEYSPTTTVPKRLPDRTFSDKSRTISDLGGINLGINTDDFFPVWLPEIKSISERIIRKKRQYPGVQIKVCKRDISNAFKRVPHPSGLHIYFLPLIRESVKWIGTGFYRGMISMPFGCAASPDIFAMFADDIQRVHHSGRAQDGSW